MGTYAGPLLKEYPGAYIRSPKNRYGDEPVIIMELSKPEDAEDLLAWTSKPGKLIVVASFYTPRKLWGNDAALFKSIAARFEYAYTANPANVYARWEIGSFPLTLITKEHDWWTGDTRKERTDKELARRYPGSRDGVVVIDGVPADTAGFVRELVELVGKKIIVIDSRHPCKIWGGGKGDGEIVDCIASRFRIISL